MTKDANTGGTMAGEHVQSKQSSGIDFEMRRENLKIESFQDVEKRKFISRIKPLKFTQQDLNEIKIDNSMSDTNLSRPQNSRLKIPWTTNEGADKKCGGLGHDSRLSRDVQLEKRRTLINPSLKLDTVSTTKDCGGVATETIKHKSTPAVPQAELIIRQGELKDRNEQATPNSFEVTHKSKILKFANTYNSSGNLTGRRIKYITEHRNDENYISLRGVTDPKLGPTTRLSSRQAKGFNDDHQISMPRTNTLCNSDFISKLGETTTWLLPRLATVSTANDKVNLTRDSSA